MRHSTTHALVGALIVSFCLTIPGVAQESAQERAASLRAQLVEIQAKQAELQMRLQQLEEDLKPENIEHSLAGVGSTHPEELREARRRQLEIQKKSIQSQLDVLAASRTRLEAAIASADAETYRANAGIGAGRGPAQTNNRSTVSNSTRRQKKHRVRRRRPTRRTKATG
jgi:chromosome segregation ATPase